MVQRYGPCSVIFRIFGEKSSNHFADLNIRLAFFPHDDASDFIEIYESHLKLYAKSENR